MGVANLRKKTITPVQPQEADEMVDEDIDVAVQSGHQILTEGAGVAWLPISGHKTESECATHSGGDFRHYALSEWGWPAGGGAWSPRVL